MVSDPAETLLCCRLLKCCGKQSCNTPFQMKMTLIVKFKFLSMSFVYHIQSISMRDIFQPIQTSLNPCSFQRSHASPGRDCIFPYDGIIS